MLSPRAWFSALLVLVCVALTAAGQSVVSTRAGLVHYFEGVVAINGEPLQAQFGHFPEIGEGAELRTGQGRAEVLLGPGVIMRVADDSVVKMLSTSLANVRLQLLAGSAIIESKDALPGNSVTLLYKDWQVRTPKGGVYRVDADPAQLRIYSGEVEVRTANGTPVTAKAGQTLPLGTVLVPEETVGAPGDSFNEWAFQRSEAIAADNATASQIVDDPALYPNLIDASGLSMAGYTYFPPMVGNPYLGYGGIYSTYGPGGYAGYLESFGAYGYPYALGSGFGLRSPYIGMPGRIGPGVLPRLPNSGGAYNPGGIGGYRPGGYTGVGVYHPGVGGAGGIRPGGLGGSGIGGYHPGGGFSTRPGLGGTAMPHPAGGAPAIRGGRH